MAPLLFLSTAVSKRALWFEWEGGNDDDDDDEVGLWARDVGWIFECDGLKDLPPHLQNGLDVLNFN